MLAVVAPAPLITFPPAAGAGGHPGAQWGPDVVAAFSLTATGLHDAVFAFRVEQLDGCIPPKFRAAFAAADHKDAKVMKVIAALSADPAVIAKIAHNKVSRTHTKSHHFCDKVAVE